MCHIPQSLTCVSSQGLPPLTYPPPSVLMTTAESVCLYTPLYGTFLVSCNACLCVCNQCLTNKDQTTCSCVLVALEMIRPIDYYCIAHQVPSNYIGRITNDLLTHNNCCLICKSFSTVFLLISRNTRLLFSLIFECLFSIKG